MGLFISNCPKCDSEIRWFLEAPKNHVCECGYAVGEEEIKLSHIKNYSEHLVQYARRRLQNHFPEVISEFDKHISSLRGNSDSYKNILSYINLEILPNYC